MGQEVFPFGLINEYDSSERLVRSGIAQDPKKRLQFIPRINILAWDDFGLGGKEQGGALQSRKSRLPTELTEEGAEDTRAPAVTHVPEKEHSRGTIELVFTESLPAAGQFLEGGTITISSLRMGK